MMNKKVVQLKLVILLYFQSIPSSHEENGTV